MNFQNNSQKIVFCVGMKRSGSTLQFNVARLLLEANNEVLNLGYIPDNILINNLKSLKNNNKIILIKNHDPDPDILEKLLTNDNFKVLYTYRDLRSIYSSMKKRSNINLSQFINYINGELKFYSKYKNDNRVLFQKYENLYDDLYQGIIEISNYLEIEKNNTYLFDNIAEKLNIDQIYTKSHNFNLVKIITYLYRKIIFFTPKMLIKFLKKSSLIKKSIKKVRIFISPDFTSQMYSDHISSSKGHPDSWRNSLSISEVNIINNKFNKWLKDQNYL